VCACGRRVYSGIYGGAGMNITQKVIDIVTREEGLPPSVVRPDSTFAELGVDSLDALNILYAIEREFEVEIPDSLAKNVTNVGQIIEILTPIVEATDGVG
jgi:acyl carrier protein